MLALRHETATRSALGLYSQLLFAALLERIVLRTVPSPLSATGWAIILGAQAYAVVSPHLCPGVVRSHSYVCVPVRKEIDRVAYGDPRPCILRRGRRRITQSRPCGHAAGRRSTGASRGLEGSELYLDQWWL